MVATITAVTVNINKVTDLFAKNISIIKLIVPKTWTFVASTTENFVGLNFLMGSSNKTVINDIKKNTWLDLYVALLNSLKFLSIFE